MDRALLFVIAGICFGEQFLSLPQPTTDPAINPQRATGEIVQKVLDIITPKNAHYGLYGERDANIFTLWGYWNHRGCGRRRAVAQVDVDTITTDNYRPAAVIIVMAGAKFLSLQKRKKTAPEHVAFEKLPQSQQKIVNDLWNMGHHIGTHTAEMGMSLFVTLSSYRGEPTVSWCLTNSENRDRQKRVAAFVLPRLEMLEENALRDVINKRISRAYEKTQDAAKRAAPKQRA